MTQISLIQGKDPTNLPRTIAVDATGAVMTAASAAASTVRVVDVAGDSCMDEVNDALQVNVVAGAAGGGRG